MTHPTDEELDALVQDLRPMNGCNEFDLAVEAITALRAQLADVQAALDNANKIMDDWTTLHRVIADIRDASGIGSRLMLSELAHEIGKRIAEANARADRAEAERAFTVSDGQRLMRKQDIITVCDTPDLCFEHDGGVARCGPCAAKLAERAGIALNQYTVSNPEAMRLRRDLDRAEAEKAAQIEADAGIAEDAWLDGVPVAEISAAIRSQPQDRSALDRLLAEAREQALREAAAVATDWQNETGTDIAAAARICPQIADAILALIEAPNAKP